MGIFLIVIIAVITAGVMYLNIRTFENYMENLLLDILEELKRKDGNDVRP